MHLQHSGKTTAKDAQKELKDGTIRRDLTVDMLGEKTDYKRRDGGESRKKKKVLAIFPWSGKKSQRRQK